MSSSSSSLITNHKLRYKWKVWFHHRKSGGGQFGFGDYEKSTHPLATFDDVEGFWAIYSSLVRPTSQDLPFVSEYQIFKQDIKPIWEDLHNIRGGKWVIRLRKNSTRLNYDNFNSQITQKVWEWILLKILGGGGGDIDSNIAGIVLSVRRKEDIISIWTTDSNNLSVKQSLKTIIQDILESCHVPQSAITFAPKQQQQQQTSGLSCFIEYRVHVDSMIEGTSRAGDDKPEQQQHKYPPPRRTGFNSNRRRSSSPENQSRRSHHHKNNHHNNNNNNNNNSPAWSTGSNSGTTAAAATTAQPQRQRRIISEAERASVRGNPFE